jgi:hypothetical protein
MHTTAMQSSRKLQAIWKIYDYSLYKNLGKMNLIDIKPILKQLFLCQLHAFNACGFLHMDIHLGNILVKEYSSKKKDKLKYLINKKKYIYEFDYRIILMDYDQSVIINNNITPLPKHNPNYTLIFNIVKTVNCISKLLPINDGKILNDNIEKAQIGFPYHVFNYGESILRSYYKKYRDYDEYIDLSIHLCIMVINEFWKIVYNKYLFPEYTLDGKN